MSDSEDDRGVSRRSFLQFVGIGAGMVTSALLAPPLSGHMHAASGEENMPESSTVHISLSVNGAVHQVLVEPRWSLLHVLREILGLTGTKIGCDRGECGACTVLIDDIPRYACLTLAVEVAGCAVTTVEGLLDGEELGVVQNAFVDEDAFQCGYCTSGQIMAVEGLLRRIPAPTAEEIRIGCSGNLCRCGAYRNIFAAAEKAAMGRKKKET